ncbi:catalase [Xylona heveae TC161]|uniref:Catalase n=1 Tax=Xylona heveae (strain CBS 132557 / TC161) TaxID=1328760 RepID=A0A165GFM1_XYLHT|nr:catalase [Xylona heveae TC161]KZF22125.1 catalase [Xylona heveae TC161]
MTSIISSGLEKVQHTMSSATEGAKIADLKKDTIDVHDPNNRITTDFGVKSSNTDDWLKASSGDKTGPMLLEDFVGREKIHRFDHERIPERVVHARGAAAFGTFKLYESAEDVTTAGVLTDTSRSTPVFLRFSTVLGSRGSADTVRDVRGFAVKFYTDEGNWDIVGNNIPVFFIQDAIKFPDIIHAGKPEPHNEVPQAQTAHNNFWDFQFLHTETTHMFMWTQSDRAIPRSYRMMQGFGVNTFTLTNKKGERHFVKFHFTPTLGVHSLVWDEALKIAGQDPDFHRKDLWDAIEAGAYPKWRFGIQTIPESKEHDFDFDILDATKVWPEELVPIRYIGELELNRNPDEYFTQTEQVAFCTSHVVPGIGFSDDPLLQGRNFSYFDTQITRLGVNWEELPINRPVCPYMNHQRDGAMRHRISKGTVNYWPNRFGVGPPATKEEGGYLEYPEKIAGLKQRLRSKKFSDHYSQAQLFYNSLAPHEKAHVLSALSFELDHCDDPVVYTRLTERLADIDLELAQGVAEAVGAPVPQKAGTPNHNKKSPSLSQTYYNPKEPTIATRRVAILVADGFDPVAYYGVKAALTAAGALPFTIGPRRLPVHAQGEDKSGKGVSPDHHFEGMRSTLFDSIFIPGGAHVEKLRKNGRALHWVREAFGHLKAIGATGEAVALVRDACQLPGVQFSSSNEVVDSYGVVTAAATHPQSFKETIKMVKGAKDFIDVYTYNIAQHKNYQRELDGLASMVAF